MFLKTLPFAAVLALVGGCADSSHLLERGVVYTPPGWPAALAADIYVPANPGLRPAVLLVHGGGWEGRDRSDMDGIAERLATRGFVVMNVSYRFAPAYRFPAQLQDMQQAVRWLRSRAPRRPRTRRCSRPRRRSCTSRPTTRRCSSTTAPAIRWWTSRMPKT
jgi:hypothetical protein